MDPAGQIKQGWSALKESALCLWRHPGLTGGMMVLDGLFLFLLGMISEIYGAKIVDVLLAISTKIIPASSISADASQTAISSPAVQGLIIQAVSLLFLMGLCAGLLFCLIEGLAWRLGFVALGRKEDVWRFLARVIRVCAIIFPFFLLSEGLGLLSDFHKLAVERMPGIGVWDVSYLSVASSILLGYLVIVSLSIMDAENGRSVFKRMWQLGFKGFFGLFLRALALILLGVIVEYTLRYLITSGMWSLILGAIELLIFLSLARATLIIICSKHISEKPDLEKIQ